MIYKDIGVFGREKVWKTFHGIFFMKTGEIDAYLYTKSASNADEEKGQR